MRVDETTQRLTAAGARPNDKIIVGTAPHRIIMSHSGDGHIAMFYESGEGGWFDANEVAAALGGTDEREPIT